MNVKPTTDTKANGLNPPRTPNDKKKKITFGVLDVRHHRQISMKKRDQWSIRQRQPRIALKTSLCVPLNTRKSRHLLSFPKLRIQSLDALCLTIREVCPHLVPNGRRHALLKQFTDLLALSRLRRGSGRHQRYPFQLARTVRFNARAHVARRRRCHRR